MISVVEAQPPELPGADVRAARMSVLHVLWSGGLGGAERAVTRLVREQLRAGSVDPTIFFAQGEGPFVRQMRDVGCGMLVARVASNRSITSVGAIARKMSGFDVHHFHSAEPLLMLASTRVTGVARVYTHRGGTYRYGPGKRVRLALCGAILRRRFHAYSGNTSHGAVCACDLLHLDRDRMRTTYNGIDFDELRPSRARDLVRLALGVTPDEFVLGTSAVLKEWKRVDILIRALAELHEERARLLVVGDGPERRNLERLAAELVPGDRVLFVGRQETPWDYLQAMDAFSLPSTGLESFGNAAVEAMALGLPTVVFADGGGLVEHIENGTTGFVVRSSRELEGVLRRLMSDETLRATIGAQGARAVRQRYTLENSTAAYRELYDYAIGRAVEEATL